MIDSESCLPHPHVVINSFQLFLYQSVSREGCQSLCIGWVNWTLPVSPKGMFMQISVWKNGPETAPKKTLSFCAFF